MARELPLVSRAHMHIVYVNRHHHPVVGGAELHVQALAERHAARGHTVTVLTQRTSDANTGAVDPSLPEQEDRAGVKVIRFTPEEPLARRLNRALQLPGAWRLARVFLSASQMEALSEGQLVTRHVWRALRDRVDVITTVNWGYPDFLVPFYMARRLLRAPILGMPLLHTELSWTEDQGTAEMLAASGGILANTEHELRFCAARGYPADRVHVCGTGTDPAALAHADGRDFRARHGLGDDPVVGYVGRMQVAKGVTLLIEAMRLVWKSHPQARLLLAGRDLRSGTLDHEAFRAALAGLAPGERARVVHIDGFAAEDKGSIFAACDVYAMSSVSDSFGQTYLESWLCGRPVIGARIPAIECVIDHGVDGLLVAPRSAPALADAIVQLLADPLRRQVMGAAGRAKTLARFTWDRVTDRVEAAYRATLDRRRGSSPRAG